VVVVDLVLESAGGVVGVVEAGGAMASAGGGVVAAGGAEASAGGVAGTVDVVVVSVVVVVSGFFWQATSPQARPAARMAARTVR
jgi:hypothetical protein